MRASPILVSILALLCSVLTQRADDIPKAKPFDRYAVIMDRSPFALATAAVPPAATPNFAKDLYVANAAKSPDGDMVTIASSSDRNFKEYLTTKGPVDGYTIANIEWSERVGATKVTIGKDGQFATLTFNQALLSTSGPPNSAPPPMSVPPPAVPLPSAPPPGIINVPKQVMPSVPTPPPRVRGVIPRNPVAPPAPTPYIVPPPEED